MNQLEQDIYNSAIEKLAASNLRSDLVLGRLLPSKITALQYTPRYSFNNPGQILADIRSTLRGKGKDVGALTQELTNRGIPYKVRGKGLSPRDIELDFYKWHKILETPYLPSNYSDSFVKNNVNRRLDKTLGFVNKAGYNVKPHREYNNPHIERYGPHVRNIRNKNTIELAIPYEGIDMTEGELQFDKRNASSILHETNELNRAVQKSQQYDKTIKNIEQGSGLRTAGEFPGVIVPHKPGPYEHNIKPLDMFGDSNINPYNFTGGNNHNSATILMNELMDEHALQVGIKPEPGSINDTFSYRMKGPDNPVNRITGIDLTSLEQPFVPRNIARNKKEYLKRIRAVRKAEDALQREYLRKKKLFDRTAYPYYSLEKMIDDQVKATLKRESKEELFKAFPQNIKFKNISDFDQYLQKNPAAKQYIENNHERISRRRSELPDNIDEWLRNLPPDKKLTFDESTRFVDAQSLLRSVNEIFNEDFMDLVDAYKERDIIKNFYNYINNAENKYRQHITGNSQQNMNFLINYLRSRGIPV